MWKEFLGVKDGVSYYWVHFSRPKTPFRIEVDSWIRERFREASAAIVPAGIVAKNLQAQPLQDVVRLPGIFGKRRQFFLNLLQDGLSLRNDFGNPSILPIQMSEERLHQD